MGRHHLRPVGPQPLEIREHEAGHGPAPGHAAIPPPTVRRRLLSPPLRLRAQPPRPSARGRHQRRFPDGTARPRWAAGRISRVRSVMPRHRLLRSRSQSLGRHRADCVGQADGAGGGAVSPRVPSVRRRHPAHRVDHGSRRDGRQEPAPSNRRFASGRRPGCESPRASRTAADLSRSRAPHRLDWARAGARRPARHAPVSDQPGARSRLTDRKTLEEVPLIGLSFRCNQFGLPGSDA